MPCYENPYAMDFQESTVTCCEYMVDCPGPHGHTAEVVVMGLYIVGTAPDRAGVAM